MKILGEVGVLDGETDDTQNSVFKVLCIFGLEYSKAEETCYNKIVF